MTLDDICHHFIAAFEFSKCLEFYERISRHSDSNLNLKRVGYFCHDLG